MTDNNETLDMLDETLDDLHDLPETKPFPVGAHLVDVRVRRMEKKPGAFVVEMTHKEVVELASPTDDESKLPKPGDKSTVFIYTRTKEGKPNEIGQGQLKNILKPLAEVASSNVINEILDCTKNGVTVVAVVGLRKSKDEQYEDQQDIKSITVV